jgi:hypothetical protein
MVLMGDEKDFDFINDLYSQIISQYGKNPEATEFSVLERPIVLTWYAMGVIENGGFQYLFESKLPGDPDYMLTWQAFVTIASKKAEQAFRKALSLFPQNRPPKNDKERLELFLSHSEQKRDSIDSALYGAHDEIGSCLLEYIRRDEDSFRYLKGN